MTDADSLNTLSQNFGTWGTIVIFGLYILYQTIREYYKSKKDTIQRMESMKFQEQVYKQMTENSKTNQEISKYLKIATQKYMDEISETQVRILVDSIFDSSQNKILFYLLKIMKDNQIHGNEKEVAAKTKAFISNRCHQDTLFLKEFQYNGIYISEHMDEKWKEYLIENTTNIIIGEKGEKALISTIQNAFEGFKCEIFDKLF